MSSVCACSCCHRMKLQSREVSRYTNHDCVCLCVVEELFMRNRAATSMQRGAKLRTEVVPSLSPSSTSSLPLELALDQAGISICHVSPRPVRHTLRTAAFMPWPASGSLCLKTLSSASDLDGQGHHSHRAAAGIPSASFQVPSKTRVCPVLSCTIPSCMCMALYHADSTFPSASERHQNEIFEFLRHSLR